MPAETPPPPAGAAPRRRRSIALACLGAGAVTFWLASAEPRHEDRYARLSGTIAESTVESEPTLAQEDEELVVLTVGVRFDWQGEPVRARSVSQHRRPRGDAPRPLPAAPEAGSPVEVLVDRAEPSRIWLPGISGLPEDLAPAAWRFPAQVAGSLLAIVGVLLLASAGAAGGSGSRGSAC